MPALLAILLSVTQPGGTVGVSPLTANDIRINISAALRAETLRDRTLPDVPRRFRFQCLVEPTARTLAGCRDLPPDASAYTSLASFTGPVKPPADPATDWRQVALDRIAGIRLRRSSPLVRNINDVPLSVIIDETVAAEDVTLPEGDPTVPPLAAADLVYDEPPTLDLIQSFYPPAALRTGTRARIVSRCLVQADRSLACRDPHLDPPDQYMTPAERRAFRQASVQLISAFRLSERARDESAVVGRTVDLGVSWLLP